MEQGGKICDAPSRKTSKPLLSSSNSNSDSYSNRAEQKRNISSSQLSPSNGNSDTHFGDKAGQKPNVSASQVSSSSESSSTRPTNKDVQKRNPSASHAPCSNSNSTSHLPKHKESVRLSQVVAIDCEMVGAGPTGKESILARVSIVDAYGKCIYDEFVKPEKEVTDYRTNVSGIRPEDLIEAKDFRDAQEDVLNILENKVVVGHALKCDFAALFMTYTSSTVRDTSYYQPFRDLVGPGVPSLKKLASEILGVGIQGGEHSSVEDAHTAMLLYLKVRNDWEKQFKRRKKGQYRRKDQT